MNKQLKTPENLNKTQKNIKNKNGKIFDFYHFLCYNSNVV